MITKKEIDIKITSDMPPAEVYLKAVEMFGVDFFKGIIFTVNDTIYVDKGKLSADLFEHESTHVKQQNEMGWKEWWKEYFKNEDFRYSQELEAYRNQYAFIKRNVKDRNKVAKYLDYFASDLSGAMYGKIKGKTDALIDIKSKL